MPKLSWLVLVLVLGALVRPTAAARPMIVAVLYFDNNTGDATYDVLQKGMADMLVTDLAGVPALRVVEREKLEELLEEMRLQRTTYFDPKTAQKLGRGIGARYVVTGAFAAIDPAMRIDIRLVEVATARVVMADKVIGKRDALFDLEAALVAKFIEGLKVRAKVAPTGGAGDLDTLLQYSQGLDSADKGDLEQASRTLGAVVRRAPRFTLAQKKYTEILKRLRLAKKRREKGLSADEELLLANIRRALARDLATLDDKEIPAYFGYRVALGNYHLAQMRKLAGLRQGESGPRWIAPAQRAALADHLRRFFASTETFVAEMRAHRKRLTARGRRFDVPMEIPEDDRQRGQALGIAGNIGEWSFASPHRVERTLAEMAVTGASPFWVDVDRFTVRPALAELDPAYGRKALAMLARARAGAEKHESGEARERMVAEAIDTHAEALLRLGRREEAIAQWQSFLDQYPKATQYEAFEAKIEAMLGISEEAQAFQAALSACTNDFFMHLYKEAERVARAEGTAGLRRLVGEVEGTCNKGPMAPAFASQTYYHAAREAGDRGDCALYGELEAKARALDAAYAEPIGKLETPCR